MRLLHIEMERFRNHRSTAMACSPFANILIGDNGEGKTNVLEAISFLCLTKSFYAASDGTALQIGASAFTITGKLESDHDVPYRVSVTYDGQTAAKRMTINTAPVERFASVVGDFPVVVLSPENNAITFGGPGDRRKFIDIVIAQASRPYVEDLLEYRKILRQRNRILVEAKQNRSDCTALLEPWNEGLIVRGSRIMRKRREFVTEFKPLVKRQFEELVGGIEDPGLEYESSAEGESTAEIEISLRKKIAAHSTEERRTGSSLVGPHRDELAFTINGLELRKFASQGQHKTFLVALKLAEFFYLKEWCRETPLLLLDDVFSELDEHRSVNLLCRAVQLGQIFITTTDDTLFRKNIIVPYRRHRVNQGSIIEGETITVDGNSAGVGPA